MAQPDMAPKDPRAEGSRASQASQASQPVAAAVAASPPTTKSLWRRFLPRSTNASRGSVSPTPADQVDFPDERAASLDASRLPSGSAAAANPTVTLTAAAGAVSDSTAPRPGGSSRRPHRDVVAGLPRAQTFARQQSELRENLLAVKPTPDERRATSMDRRLLHSALSLTASQSTTNPRASAPNFGHAPRRSAPEFVTLDDHAPSDVVPHVPFAPSLRSRTSAGDLASDGTENDDTAAATNRYAGKAVARTTLSDFRDSSNSHHHQDEMFHSADGASLVDTASMSSSQYEQTLLHELEHIWILNLSMHFRDKSRREKFFVTYRQRPDLWRRVTVSLDYRNAPENSLEMDLLHTKFQRDKNEKIYEAIRESLSSIQFYDTVTNLKLQTTEGRLHVHVVEDVTEIIKYPTIGMVQHLHCRIIRERDIEFDSHMSGFVYKVRVDGRMLIKKEIPGPDSVDEFLYEVNALNFLSHSRNVIGFYGVIVDDRDCVTGLLIDYAEQGALIDIIYDNDRGIPWPTRAKWARQIVQGLSEIHEAGYVQGDFTLSNIVIDDDGNAKIIDINRRGCPVGWEPPEATPLIENKQRISMYIGVKSDLYQLGMVLWALTMQDDEPEAHSRPLHLPADVAVPSWFRTVVETCLDEDPRARAQARQLVRLFPVPEGRSEYSDFSDYDDVDWVGDRRPPVLNEQNYPPMPLGHDAASLQHEATTRSPSGYSDDAYAGMDTGVDNLPADGVAASTSDWSYVNLDPASIDSMTRTPNEPFPYLARGRSPPNPNRRSRDRNSHHSYSDQHVSPSIEREQSKQPAESGETQPVSPVSGADCSSPEENRAREDEENNQSGKAASSVALESTFVASDGVDNNINQLDSEESKVLPSNEEDCVAPKSCATSQKGGGNAEESQTSDSARPEERQNVNKDAHHSERDDTEADASLAAPNLPPVLEVTPMLDSKSISPNLASKVETAQEGTNRTEHHNDRNLLADDEPSMIAVA